MSKTFLNWSKFSEEKFVRDFRGLDWNEILKLIAINASFDSFNAKVMQVVDRLALRKGDSGFLQVFSSPCQNVIFISAKLFNQNLKSPNFISGTFSNSIEARLCFFVDVASQIILPDISIQMQTTFVRFGKVSER